MANYIANVIVLIGLCTELVAQPLSRQEIETISFCNDTQMFVSVPGYKFIKRYRDYFKEVEKQSGILEEEMGLIGIWDIPAEEGEKEIVHFKDYSINGTVTILPNKKFIVDYNWFSKTFPIVFFTGSWYVENKSLYMKVELLVTVKTPVEFEKKDGLIKPKIQQYNIYKPDWPFKVVYDNIDKIDLVYGYLYYPFNIILDKHLLPIEVPDRYWTEKRRGTRYATEEMYRRHPLIREYEEYLKITELKKEIIEEKITNRYYAN